MGGGVQSKAEQKTAVPPNKSGGGAQQQVEETGGAIVEAKETVSQASLAIVVIGASGDLAKKKTFPALFSLFSLGLLPPDVVIAGYARSAMDHDTFLAKISQNFSKAHSQKEAFLSRCFYFAGQYDAEGFGAFHSVLSKKESEIGSGDLPANRIFYFAIPPTIFVAVGKGIQPAAHSQTGWNRVVVEKPFGSDSESSAALGEQLAQLFQEEDIYRIDHYLGKEMVQNLMVMRFANAVFEPLWNAEHVNCVIISFKENFGTKGRGGYFDSFGIIRDVMQNHLLQILSLVAMEQPASMEAEDVRNAKVNLLRDIKAIERKDVVIGQYKAPADGSEPGYLDDKSVPNDSVTPTFATAVLHVNNDRWQGTPFILKCGKALDARKAEIRIQFKTPANNLFKQANLSSNELVLVVQPDEAVYLKMSTKQPGLKGGVEHTELDLTYNSRFTGEEGSELVLPEAYERLILDVVQGDHNLFVRADELEAAWKIFTPILHQLERSKAPEDKPILYEYGSRGPPESDALIKDYGYIRTKDYTWASKKKCAK